MIAVLANDAQWIEISEGAVLEELERITSLTNDAAYDGYVLLEAIEMTKIMALNKPVLINAVITSLPPTSAGTTILRINGWTGFLARKTWEVAGELTDTIRKIFSPLNRGFIQATDEPGLIAARTIAMIINEAYFALGEGVSSTTEIDTAMKLGTNYPYGPFEWAEKIGIENIHALLQTLSTTDQRYFPAPLLKKAANA